MSTHLKSALCIALVACACALTYAGWRVLGAVESVAWHVDAVVMDADVTLRAVAPDAAASARAVRISTENVAAITQDGRALADKYTADLTAPKSPGSKVAAVLKTIGAIGLKAIF